MLVLLPRCTWLHQNVSERKSCTSFPEDVKLPPGHYPWLPSQWTHLGLLDSVDTGFQLRDTDTVRDHKTPPMNKSKRGLFHQEPLPEAKYLLVL